MAARRVVVAGGNGFLGLYNHSSLRSSSRSCMLMDISGKGLEFVNRQSLEAGPLSPSGTMFFSPRNCSAQCSRPHSRSGEPRWETVTSSRERPDWSRSVEWAKADMLNPQTYKPFLNGATVVVHSMGILLEADYKGVVQGREPLLSGLQKVFSSSRLGSQNPLQRREGEALQAQDKNGQLTYELMNRDSGSYMSWIPSGVKEGIKLICRKNQRSHWRRKPPMNTSRLLYISQQHPAPPSSLADTSRRKEKRKQPYPETFRNCEASSCALPSCTIPAENSRCRSHWVVLSGPR